MTESTDTSSASDGTPSSSPGRRRSPLRKLSDEQELELTRLYSETETPVPDIARRFGIGEASVYRVSQRHGARLRTRTSVKPRAAAKPKTEASQAQAKPRRTPGRPRRTAAPAVPAAALTASTTSAAAASPRTGRGRRSQSTQTASGPRRATAQRAAQATAPRTTRARAPRSARASAVSRYRVVFVAETVIQAGTVREAIAQAEARGATEIRSIVQAD